MLYMCDLDIEIRTSTFVVNFATVIASDYTLGYWSKNPITFVYVIAVSIASSEIAWLYNYAIRSPRIVNIVRHYVPFMIYMYIINL